MIYTVKTLQQKTFTIEAEPTETILEFKTKIEVSQGFAVATQKLIHTVDSELLSSYNLTEKTFIVVMLTKPKAPPTTAAPKPVVVAAPVESVKPVESAVPPAGGPFTESSLATGSEYELAVNNLCDMGFELEQVKAAMRAAFNNPDRAAEYLMTVLMACHLSHNKGIPATSEPQAQAAPQAPSQDAPSGNLFEQAALEAARAPAPVAGQQGDANSLDFLRNMPQFAELRDLVRTQPHLIQPLLQQLAQSNPDLLATINANRDGFMRMLTEGGEGMEGMEGGEGGEAEYITVTPEENESISRLVALGFDRSVCVEAFFACDKNEELAANYLFDNGGQDDWQ